MKFKLVILVILLILPIQISAQIENYNDVKTLDMSFILSGNIDLIRETESAKLESLKADVKFIPYQDFRQRVIDTKVTTNPQAEVNQKEGELLLEWNTNEYNKLSYSFESKIETLNTLQSIKNKIDFPLVNIDQSIIPYAQATEFIDITPKIEAKTREIVGQDNDLYSIVFKLADWNQNNIKYDLTTLTAEVVQKSSWVLDNKEGVCDEMTNLFISMLRSLGIPAKFISGMVYSNTNYKWGPHGWAEVYFPGVGWVPFDVTFRQYGWIDPSHIKLKEDYDSGSASSKYEWKAKDIEVRVSPLNLETSVIQTKDKIEPLLLVSASPIRKQVGFGSLVPLQVTVENPNDFYISTSIYVRKATQLTEKNVKSILLKPRSHEIIYWLMEIPSNLDEDFIYKSTIELQTSFNDIIKTEVQYANSFPEFTKEQADKIVERSYIEEKEKEINLDLSCKTNREYYYSNESVSISCDVINLDQISKINACIYEQCTTFSLEPFGEKKLDFNLELTQTTRIPFIVSNENGFKTFFIPVNIIKIPEVFISDLEPEKIDFNKQLEITFIINAETKVYDLKINTLSDILTVGDFQGQKKIVITTDGRSMMNGLRFIISYKDENGKVYNKSEAVVVKVENIPWYAKIVYGVINFFKNLF